jgi:hypothetical protein
MLDRTGEPIRPNALHVQYRHNFVRVHHPRQVIIRSAGARYQPSPERENRGVDKRFDFRVMLHHPVKALHIRIVHVPSLHVSQNKPRQMEPEREL